MENIAIVYSLFGLLTMVIGAYRAARGKLAVEPGPLDALAWFSLWWVFLPVYVVRYIKYKLKGESI